MEFKLPGDTFRALDAVERSKADNLVALARDAGQDTAHFFEGEDWSGLDLTGCGDLKGVSFRDAVMDRVTAYEDQWAVIEASQPRSARERKSLPRSALFASKAAEMAYGSAEELIRRVLATRETLLTVWDEDLSALDQLPPKISHLLNLKELYLSGTQISDITVLAKLANLELLNMSDTRISDLIPISCLTKLQGLYLTNTQVTDLSPLRRLSRITELNLTGTAVANLSPISSLDSLTKLRIDNTLVTEIGPVSSLGALRMLTLECTQVTDLAPLAGLTALTHLDLDGTPVTDLTPIQPMIDNGLTVYGP